MRTKAIIKIDSFIAKSAPRVYNSAYLMEVVAKEAQETMDVFIPQSDMWRSMDGGWTPEPLGITTNDL